jgi:uncharacterized protein (TIRG00374 family)
MNKTTQKIGKWVIAIVIMAVSMYLALRKLDLNLLWKELQSANLLIALIPVPIMLLSHWIRAIRWKTILNPIMKVNSTMNLFSAVMVGYFFNNVMPRGGEVMRPYVYAKREGKSFSTIFSTIVLERLLDILTLLFLMALALMVSKDTIMNAFPEGSNWNNLIYLLTIGCVVGILCLYPPIMNWLLHKLVRPINEKIYLRLTDIFEKFIKGFRILRTPSMYFKVIFESLLIWACYAIPMYVHFYCFGFSSEISLHFTDALFLLVVSGIGVSIAPSPGGMGVFHYVVAFAVVAMYGITKEQATAYATINHAVNFAVQVLFGFGFFLRERIQRPPQSNGNGLKINNTAEVSD